MNSQSVQYDDVAEAARKFWWLFLVGGIFWFLVSLVVLRFNTQSVTTIGILIGIVFGMAALSEFATAAIVRSWRWIHVVVGLLFAGGALWGFINPEEAFWALASIIGLLFVVWGFATLIESLLTKAVNSLWWLGMTSGILLILLGFWASQQYVVAKAGLLILWVGMGAMFRGITEIVMAFRVKGMGPGAGAVAMA